MRQKESWIRNKLHAIGDVAKQTVPKTFSYGEEFYYLGEPYRLLPLENSDDPIIFNQAFYINTCYSHRLKSILGSWYFTKASKYLLDRTEELARITGLKYSGFTVGNASRRWGSCSSKGNIRLSWKLILLPPEIIDYVIIHELCHLRELNHSGRFRMVVQSLMPEWKNREKWLRANGSRFQFPNI